MSTRYPQRMTQRRIAALAGVSQATVSLVLNDRRDTTGRVPPETRERVMAIIRGTTYVADPAARRLAGAGNRILGVFTYEAAFPKESANFYTPLLRGIESEAEQLGCDLLLFTSPRVLNGQRRVFHEDNRLGLADGCILLGQEMDNEELAQLVATQAPFVAIGRRAVPGVPFVGVDYATSTQKLVRLALEVGHSRFFYLSVESSAESFRDRRQGFAAGLTNSQVEHAKRFSSIRELPQAWEVIRAYHPTVLFLESESFLPQITELAAASGWSIPGDLSVVVLGDVSAAGTNPADFTRLSPPRTELGSAAVRLLDRVITGQDPELSQDLQTLLPCPVHAGTTLVVPPNERTHS